MTVNADALLSAADLLLVADAEDLLQHLDLPNTDRYREGGDYMTVLDAMKALDDLALKRAGVSSWGEGDD